MLDVEQWAEIRRMHEVEGLSIREIARRSGRDRNTVRSALRSARAAALPARAPGAPSSIPSRRRSGGS